jgi:hypothetical protein
MTTCKNCHTKFKGNFCNNCGQKAETLKLNWHFILHEIEHGVFHLDRGLFYTSKELITRPGYTIRRFIEGERVRHYKPLSYVIVLAGLWTLIDYFFAIHLPSTKDSYPYSDNEFINSCINYMWEFRRYAKEHVQLKELAELPGLSLGCFLAFKKYKNTYLEHFVINCFLEGQLLLIKLFFSPLFIYLNNKQYDTPHTDRPGLLMLSLGVILTLFLRIWGYSQFYKNAKTWYIAILCLVITMVMFPFNAAYHIIIGFFMAIFHLVI